MSEHEDRNETLKAMGIKTYPPFVKQVGGEVTREVEHTSWCRSNELDLCSACSVKKGWDHSPATGEATTCQGGKPHEWLPLPCSCGPNDRRRGDRRLREQDGEWIEEGLANLFYAYEDAKKALASVLAAYDELAFGLNPQERSYVRDVTPKGIREWDEGE